MPDELTSPAPADAGTRPSPQVERGTIAEPVPVKKPAHPQAGTRPAPKKPAPKPIAKPAPKVAVAPKALPALEEPKAEVISGAAPFPAHVAALAILAATRLLHRFSDEFDNEAERQPNGSVRLSIKQREGGHSRIFVRVPETVDLIVCDAPYVISPE